MIFQPRMSHSSKLTRSFEKSLHLRENNSLFMFKLSWGSILMATIFFSSTVLAVNNALLKERKFN
jgi:hypothetical protein